MYHNQSLPSQKRSFKSEAIDIPQSELLSSMIDFTVSEPDDYEIVKCPKKLLKSSKFVFEVKRGGLYTFWMVVISNSLKMETRKMSSECLLVSVNSSE